MLIASYTTMRHVFSTSGITAPDGLEEWPSGTCVAQIAGSSYVSPFTGVPSFSADSSFAFPITISTSFGHDCHAWLSQRTEIAPDQYLAMTEANGVVDTWTIALTARAVTELGGAPLTTTSPLNEDQLRQVVKHVRLYVQRVDNDLIYSLSLEQAIFGG